MESKRLSFALDGDQIDFKSYSKKDFLELSMKAISDANPNRNGSWFTKESIIKAKESGTCKNKPVLGYFENDDFVSHNGTWRKDSETGVDYWDTLGQKGERILGVIREQDDVDVCEDKNGQTWLCFSCALWVQYGFKQVKRLLKDAQKAKNGGGSAKNISVEVDITDYEELRDGTIKINEFNLVGVTILGSRNGTKVEPGIEGADLSVVDMMGKDIYDRQMQGLRLAYEKLSTADKKEVFDNMDQNDILESNETPVLDQPSEVVENVEKEPQETLEATFEEKAAEDENSEKKEHEEETCPECEEDPCVCEKTQEEPCSCESKDEAEDKSESESEETEEGSKEEDHIEEKESGDGCNLESEENIHQEEAKTEAEPEKTEEENKQNECYAEYEKIKGQFEELTAKYEQLSKELDEKKASFEALSQENNSLREKVAVFEHKEFLENASALLATACELTEEQSKEFYAKCDSKEITSLDELKTKVAIVTFDNTAKPVSETKNVSFNADVVIPTMTSANKDDKKKSSNKWDRMRQNVGNK